LAAYPHVLLFVRILPAPNANPSGEPIPRVEPLKLLNVPDPVTAFVLVQLRVPVNVSVQLELTTRFPFVSVLVPGPNVRFELSVADPLEVRFSVRLLRYCPPDAKVNAPERAPVPLMIKFEFVVP
jgi:hypothetical protein